MSGQQGEGLDVPRAYDAEVPVVEGRELGDAVTFGEGYDGSVGHAERQVGVLLHQLGDAAPLGAQHRLDPQQPVGDRPSEDDLCVSADAIAQQVGDLADYEMRNDEGSRSLGQQLRAGSVVGVLRRGRGVERPASTISTATTADGDGR